MKIGLRRTKRISKSKMSIQKSSSDAGFEISSGSAGVFDLAGDSSLDSYARMPRRPEFGPPLAKYRRVLPNTDVGRHGKRKLFESLMSGQPCTNWKFSMECVLLALHKYCSFMADNRSLPSQQLWNSEIYPDDSSDEEASSSNSTSFSRSFSESLMNGNSTPWGSPAQAGDSLLYRENANTVKPFSWIPTQLQQKTFSSSSSMSGKSLKPINKQNGTTKKTTLQEQTFSMDVFLKDNFAETFKWRTARWRKKLDHERDLLLSEIEMLRRKRLAYYQAKKEWISQFRLNYKAGFDVESEAIENIPLTEDHLQRYDSLIQGSHNEVVVFKFKLQIKRSDIRTLVGMNWLNDEVINFYMNLLTERSQQRAGELPSVYAMNTFFLPRLMQGGHAGVRRWTRSVDLFSKDIIPVPVHHNGRHWCMAIIHILDKTIRYYDSMGQRNQVVLAALESYLQQESLDKRHQAFDTSGFQIESVLEVPRQTNGFDCGVFSCMFAEYITRDAPITFAQDNMDYFRKKMILEIADGKLWN